MGGKWQKYMSLLSDIGCGAFALQVLRDIYGPEIGAIDLEDLMSDTESDSDSDSFSESMLEFIPGTKDHN
ncbi:UNVERIFIED_CONTAM: hypothetical protein NCL1_57292 [Trichonephila clavipes]